MKDEMKRSLMEMLEDFKGTVVLVSHSRDEIYTMSDELIIVDKGRVAASGKTKDIFTNPPNITSAVLTGCKNIASAVAGENGLYVEDWYKTIKIDNINNEVKAVGIRAHDFSLEYKPDMIEFDMYDTEVKKELFEYVIYFKTSPKAKKSICFKISSYMCDFEKNIPNKVFLKKDNLILLK
jgi:molybdate transport system ATP-binding protein